ncbi:MAG: phosphopyruvate hydratase, partial [Deltaproteobacteria bacterium]|nr:phosphopyruvate hydratase [Deltaproteobacteria bacterium]
MEIKDIHAFEVLDSRGRPTICCKMICEGIEVLASVPSGASRGDKEAIELRDEDNRFFGQGVRKAINNIITRIKPAVVYKTFCSQEEFDHFLLDLDGTKNKSNLGANAVLSVSLCFFKALAKKNGLEPWQLCASLLEEEASLPIPLINVINGGAHADNPLDFQEFMIVPFGFDTFSEALRAGVEIFYILKKTLAARGHTVSVGDEGGFAPKLQAPGEVLELLCECVSKSGYILGENIGLALDVAASELFKSGRYVFRKSSGESFTSDDLISIYEDLVSRYPIISIEDPFSQEDFEGWQKFCQKFTQTIRVV